VAVRSSSSTEADYPDRTAGVFRSELGIPGDARPALAAAIQAVFKSYGRRGRHWQDDAVIVQRQLVDVLLSAVVHVDQDRVYSRVDYDDESGSTIEVTRGRATKTLYVWPRARAITGRWRGVNLAIEAVATELKVAPLRIELAIDSRERIMCSRRNRSLLRHSAQLAPACNATRARRRSALVAARSSQTWPIGIQPKWWAIGPRRSTYRFMSFS
jgi:hypothetical protein